MLTNKSKFTRRTALAWAGRVGAISLAACDSDAPTSEALDGGQDSWAEAGSTPSPCTLYPQQVQGPYYVPGDLLRSDITEAKPGTPLTLHLRVVQPQSCQALPNIAVDVWHCDAVGVYSGFAGQLQGLDTRGQTFLRGTQLTDVTGDVVFQTIFPGWYPGRTTHIHFKVRPTAETAAVSQLYFPETLNDLVYTQNAPYASRGKKDTSNAGDGANQATGVPTLPTIEAAGGGFVARFVVAIAL